MRGTTWWRELIPYVLQERKSRRVFILWPAIHLEIEFSDAGRTKSFRCFVASIDARELGRTQGMVNLEPNEIARLRTVTN